MSTRKPRFAKYELQRMKISELKHLCTNKLRLQIIGAYSKQEIIDMILSSGKIEVISAPPPVQIQSIQLLRGMGVGKLKRTMMDAGVFFDARDVIEKEDMVQIFINSGRVVFEEEEEEEVQVEVEVQEQDLEKTEHDSEHDSGHDSGEVKRARIDEEGSCRSSNTQSNFNDQQQQQEEDETKESSSVYDTNNDTHHDHEVVVEDASLSSSSSSLSLREQASHDSATPLMPFAESTTSAQPTQDRPSTSYSYNDSADITARSVGELKQLARQLGVDLTNCLEKREMIELIVTSMARSGVGTRYGGGVVF